MINALVKRDKNSIIYGFTIENHGDPLVCSAVSSLVINCVNSITELTSTSITVDFNEDGGFMDFHLENYDINVDNDALLLLKSLHLGLKCLEIEHTKDVKLKDKTNKK